MHRDKHSYLAELGRWTTLGFFPNGDHRFIEAPNRFVAKRKAIRLLDSIYAESYIFEGRYTGDEPHRLWCIKLRRLYTGRKIFSWLKTMRTIKPSRDIRKLIKASGVAIVK